MRTSRPKSKKVTPPATDLSAVAHAQIMDFLKQAELSTNPAVTATALKLAVNEQVQFHKDQAKLSPWHATILATLILVGAAGASWFAIANYPGKTGLVIASVITTLAVLTVGLYALFTGHLSQANFMEIFRWCGSRLKFLQFWRKDESVGISLATSDDE